MISSQTYLIKTKNKEERNSAASAGGKNSMIIKDNRDNGNIQRKENKTGLPDTLKSGIENLSGISMDDVKVHFNSSQPAQLNAHAYAQGTDIHIAPGQEKHLPHEAWHVVQQKQGRVRPTMQLKNKVNINDDKGLEKEDNNNLIHHLQKFPGKNQVIQNYRDMSKGLVFGYGKGTGPATPQFEFQKTEASRTEDDTTSTATYDVHSSQSFEDAPKLKVSDNYDMAVPTSEGAEAKHFFATPARVAASNIALLAAGAPITLVPGAGQITLPGLWNPFGITLNQVSFNIAPGLIISSECGAFANSILGVNVHRIELQIAGVPVQTVLPHLGRDVPLNTALGGQSPERVGANKNADPNVGDAFGIFARHIVPPIGLVTRLWNDIVTVHGLLNPARPHMQWGEHWAGVVAKSGGDYVTLENYNRVAAGTDLILERLEKDYKEVVANGDVHAFAPATAQYLSPVDETRIQRIVRLGLGYMKYGVQIGAFTGFYHNQLENMWYFDMYGRENQSFHETWKKSAPDSVTAKIPH
jgi:hypothetical protein